jgi:hypothetical protein
MRLFWYSLTVAQEDSPAIAKSKNRLALIAFFMILFFEFAKRQALITRQRKSTDFNIF